MITAPVYEGMELGKRKYYICDSDEEKELLTVTRFTSDRCVDTIDYGNYFRYLTQCMFQF